MNGERFADVQQAASPRRSVPVARGIQPYVQQTAQKWESCTKEPASTTTSSTPEEQPEMPGTYRFTYGTASPECTRAPEQVTVSSGGGSVTLTGSFGTITSTLSGDLAFDGSLSSDVGAGVRLRGRFARFGSKTLIREGVLELQVGGGCQTSYDAERVGS